MVGAVGERVGCCGVRRGGIWIGMGAPKKSLKQNCAYSKKDILALKTVFDSYDTSGDGGISMSEMQAFLKQFNQGHMTNMAKDMFSAMDAKDSVVDFRQILKVYYPNITSEHLDICCAWVAPKENKVVEVVRKLSDDDLEEIKHIFILYDKNTDGSLSIPELKDALLATGYDEEEMEALFEANDKDKNGKISLDEFVEMMRDSYC